MNTQYLNCFTIQGSWREPCLVLFTREGISALVNSWLAQFVVTFPWNRSPPIGRILPSPENGLNFLAFLHYGNLLPVRHLAIRPVRPMTDLAWLCSPVFRLLRPLPPEPGATGPQDWLVREQYKEPGHLTLIIRITNLQPSINTHPNPNMRQSLLVAVVAAAFCFAFVAAGTCLLFVQR